MAAANSASMPTMPSDVQSLFAKDLLDVHLVYDYNVHDAEGRPEKWRYEIWFFSEVVHTSSLHEDSFPCVRACLLFIFFLFFFPGDVCL